MNEIRVRFAPSPTGHLHIGGLRTAIYNYLFAKKNNGKFFLRIEDTDKFRSDKKYTKEIIEILNWMNLHFEKNIIFQSARLQIYYKYIDTLLNSGLAYKCYCTAEELEFRAKNSEKKSGVRKYDRFCLNSKPQDKPYIIRFKVPDGITLFDDIVRGKIKICNEEFDDFVLLKSDGMPTYHLAVVVDDIETGINYVIRGEDHISNTPKQILLYNAFEKKIPKFAHIPLILGKDRTKLSKRTGETSALYYKQDGILASALFNYLILLGWSPKNNKEIISSIDEAINLFDLSEVNKSGAIFDYAKLEWLNSQHIKRLSPENFYNIYNEYTNNSVEKINKEYFYKIFGLLKERIKTLKNFKEMSNYFFSDDYKFDEHSVEKYLKNQNVKYIIEKIKSELLKIPDEIFTNSNIEKIIRETASSLNIKAAEIIHPLRVLLTGKSESPGLFEVMELLGKNKVIARLRDREIKS